MQTPWIRPNECEYHGYRYVRLNETGELESCGESMCGGPDGLVCSEDEANNHFVYDAHRAIGTWASTEYMRHGLEHPEHDDCRRCDDLLELERYANETAAWALGG